MKENKNKIKIKLKNTNVKQVETLTRGWAKRVAAEQHRLGHPAPKKNN